MNHGRLDYTQMKNMPTQHRTCTSSSILGTSNHEHTFSGMGPKNGMAAPIHARQSATNTPNPGMMAHDVNPHSVSPRPRSMMKLFVDVMRALTMRMMHSVVTSLLSTFLGTRWSRVVRRASEGDWRCRESSLLLGPRTTAAAYSA